MADYPLSLSSIIITEHLYAHTHSFVCACESITMDSGKFWMVENFNVMPPDTSQGIFIVYFHTVTHGPHPICFFILLEGYMHFKLHVERHYVCKLS